MREINGHYALPTIAEEFRRCLVDTDVDGIMRAWKHVAPNMPQPETREDALITLHIARTGSHLCPFRLRAYSHRWLTERNLPSHLPDDMKPKAERMYPRIVSAVGICIATINNKKHEWHRYVTAALCDVVENFNADGRIEDTVPLKAQMKIVYEKLRKQK